MLTEARKSRRPLLAQSLLNLECSSHGWQREAVAENGTPHVAGSSRCIPADTLQTSGQSPLRGGAIFHCQDTQDVDSTKLQNHGSRSKMLPVANVSSEASVIGSAAVFATYTADADKYTPVSKASTRR